MRLLLSGIHKTGQNAQVNLDPGLDVCFGGGGLWLFSYESQHHRKAMPSPQLPLGNRMVAR